MRTLEIINAVCGLLCVVAFPVVFAVVLSGFGG
jgi:hypothetical protein